MRRLSPRALAFALAAGLPLAPALAQDSSFGGQSGADMTLEALSPDGAQVDIGLAGVTPPDIARFLLASGAGLSRLSPDGEHIAYVSSVTGQPELWVVPATGGQPRQLTFMTRVQQFDWLPDGSGLLYSADRNGNEQEGYFRISLDGRTEASVLPANAGDFRIFGDFAPDGSFTYASTARNGLDFDIYRGTLAGESRRIFEGRFYFGPQSTSPDGRYAVVTESVGEDANNLHLLELATGALTTLSAPSPRADHNLAGFAWLPDSSGFLFSSNAGREFGALSRFDLASGRTTVLADLGADIGDIALCGDDFEGVAYLVSRDGFDSLWFDPDIDGPAAARPMGGLPEGVYGLDCSYGSGRLMVRVDGWATPGDLFVFDTPDAPPRHVFASNLAGLEPARLVRPQVVRFPARDGVELQGLLYLPHAAPQGGPPPVVFMVHGGPSAQALPDFDAVAQYHVARGVAVFAPNVRGSTGLGRTYSTLDDQEKRLDSVRDLVDLLDALGTAGLVDARRAAVQGGSYGGYMVNAVLSEYPEAFRAGVSLYGVGNWITALEVASPALKASDRIEYGDISEPRWREFYGRTSPVFRADRIRVPVLYSHGMMDPRIDIAETEIMVRALRERGIEAPFVRFADEGHGWQRLANRLFYFRTEAAFLEEQLGTAPSR